MTVRTIEPGLGGWSCSSLRMPTTVALFLGGTVATWADAGWRVVVVRVTDDRWDSVGSDEASTVAANREEFERAATILGVAEIVELGYPTDTLGDVSTVGAARADHPRRADTPPVRPRVVRPVRDVRRGQPRPHHRGPRGGRVVLDQPVRPPSPRASRGRSPRRAVGTSRLLRTLVLRPQGDGRDGRGRHLRDTRPQDRCRLLPPHDDAELLQPAADAGAHRRLEPAPDRGPLAAGTVDDVLARLLRAGSERLGATYGVGAAEEFRVVTFGGMQGLLDAVGTRL